MDGVTDGLFVGVGVVTGVAGAVGIEAAQPVWVSEMIIAAPKAPARTSCGFESFSGPDIGKA